MCTRAVEPLRVQSCWWRIDVTLPRKLASVLDAAYTILSSTMGARLSTRHPRLCVSCSPKRPPISPGAASMGSSPVEWDRLACSCRTSCPRPTTVGLFSARFGSFAFTRNHTGQRYCPSPCRIDNLPPDPIPVPVTDVDGVSQKSETAGPMLGHRVRLVSQLHPPLAGTGGTVLPSRARPARSHTRSQGTSCGACRDFPRTTPCGARSPATPSPTPGHQTASRGGLRLPLHPEANSAGVAFGT